MISREALLIGAFLGKCLHLAVSYMGRPWLKESVGVLLLNLGGLSTAR